MYNQRDYFYIISCKNTTTTRIVNCTTNTIKSELPSYPKYKFGITNNINTRIKWLKSEFRVKEIEVIYLKKYKNAKDLEDFIIDYLYDKKEKPKLKEWFGENETYHGTICKLEKILSYVDIFNESINYKQINK